MRSQSIRYMRRRLAMFDTDKVDWVVWNDSFRGGYVTRAGIALVPRTRKAR